MFNIGIFNYIVLAKNITQKQERSNKRFKRLSNINDHTFAFPRDKIRIIVTPIDSFLNTSPTKGKNENLPSHLPYKKRGGGVAPRDFFSK